MDMPVNVPVDDPNADTEWNDILRKHGVIPEKPPSPTPAIEEALSEARRLAHENRLEGKQLDELDELEDDEDEEFLEKYRKQRLAELSTISKSSIHGQVYYLQKPDYARDVTEASKQSFVLVHLTSSFQSNIESRKLTDLWRILAHKFGEIKFCEIRGDMCIEGYPEKNCPTILVYHKEDIVRQIVTLRELGGEQVTQENIEKLVVDLGIVTMTDHRVKHLFGGEEDASRRGIRDGDVNKSAEDDDSDWD
ncbi:MAG: hypothetical protein M1833_005830 [Piccolia ochrophora]|nr:MAG: hypothetical protein M1833_005830 [Piccolia ochrophora]